MEASRWASLYALLETAEISRLIDALSPFVILQASGICQPHERLWTKERFLEAHEAYIAPLRLEKLPPELSYRAAFSTAWSMDSEAVVAIPVEGERFLMRVVKPVVQLQIHRMHYSIDDQKFRSMVFGTDSISWGLHFTYPQLYLDPVTKEARQGKEFLNDALYRRLHKWLRDYTRPATFEHEGKRVVASARLGLEAIKWIAHHPQLKQFKILD